MLLTTVLGNLRNHLKRNEQRQRRRRFAVALRSTRRSPRIESLETRALLATFAVTNTNDSGAGSFRQAIQDANAAGTVDTITFNVGVGGLQTIAPLTPLPAITDPVLIDATTQVGYAGSPLIELSGASITAPGTERGLQVLSSNVQIQGLIINRFYVGVSIEPNIVSSINVSLSSNYIGTDSTGNAAAGNRFAGILLDSTDLVNIGGNTPASRNVISGNGTLITGGGGIVFGGGTTQGVLIQGNTIGLGADGNTVVANIGTGISIDNGRQSIVRNNVISGNTNAGVRLGDGTGGGNLNNVDSNIIGLNLAGTIAKPNAVGIAVLGGFNIIGGGTPASGNIISGNTGAGIQLVGNLSTGNEIQANFIGTDITGTAARPNLRGISIDNGAGGNLIGGNQAGQRNVISGNTTDAGILLGSTAGPGNSITGNLIGVDGRSAPQGAVGWWRGEGNADDFTGNSNGIVQGAVTFSTGVDAKVGRAFDFPGGIANYVQVANVAALEPTSAVTIDTWVKASAPGALNYIVAKGGDASSASYALYTDDVSGGLRFYVRTGTVFRSADAGPSIWNNVWRHVVGTYDGTQVRLFVDGVEVGAPVPVSGNIQYGLTRNDLYLGHYDSGVSQFSFTGQIDEPTVYSRALTPAEISTIYAMGNAGKAGFNAMPNQRGIHVNGADNVVIGGSTAGERNIISGNTLQGIRLVGSATGNTIVGNYVGTSPVGDRVIPNQSDGILLDAGSSGNFIGGVSAGQGNLLSGNLGAGVQLTGAGTTANQVRGNLIGTDSSGTQALGNVGNGVNLGGGASKNIIGGGASGARNIISGNNSVLTAGVSVTGAGTDKNLIQGNYIGTSQNGTQAVPNVYGVFIAGSHKTIIGVDGDGLDDSGERNVISGNFTGVWLQSDADDTTIAGNFIGLNSDGTAVIGGMQEGVRVFNDSTTRGLVVGTNSDGISDTLERNVIAGSLYADINLPTATHSTIAGNYLGIQPNGNAVFASTSTNGIVMSAGSSFNLIGSNGDGVRDDIESNVISGHSQYGVLISDPTSQHNTIAGNFIGTNALGSIAIPNQLGVVFDSGAKSNTLGGSSPGARNIIGGNSSSNVTLTGLAFDNRVSGNYIGVNKDGNASFPGTSVGVAINDGSSNQIGGTSGDGNLISGHNTGVSITGASSGNLIRGNLIGLDALGDVAIPNGEGIRITATLSNTIGGPSANSRNIIAGNSGYDVAIVANSQVIQGNWIGLADDGVTPLPGNNARIIVNGGLSNLIGGNSEGARNVISGNSIGPGVWLTQNANNNLVQGNYIGTTVSGNSPAGNDSGVAIDAGSSNNTIGGLVATQGNVISGNLFDGIDVFTGASSNRIYNNKIGTNATGTVALGNGALGVNIDTSTNTWVGIAGAGNLISGNITGGIDAISAPSTKIQANYVGTDATGSYAIPNGTLAGQHAVRFSNFQLGVIGSDEDGINDNIEGNVISGNSGNGIRVSGGAGTLGRHTVARNIVGLNASGTQAIPNGALGISIATSERNNVLSNIVSGNVSTGIDLFDTAGLGRTTLNVVANNFVGTNKLGTLGIGNASGIALRSAPGNTITDNLVSGNSSNGIAIADLVSFSVLSSNNTVSNNTVGTDEAGTYAIPNNGSGIVLLQTGTGNRIAGNLISGNRGPSSSGAGILNADTNGTVIINNRIGTTTSGDAALGNQAYGIFSTGNNITIGTNGDGIADDSEGNLISANGQTGIALPGGANSFAITIAGNKIGTNSSANRALGGQSIAGIALGPTVGVRIGSDNNGTSDALEGNIISGSLGSGITITGAALSNALIQGNAIGTDWSKTYDIGNGGTGITISNSSTAQIINNTISGNDGGGVLLAGGTSDVDILSNTIGTSASGILPVPNGTNAVPAFGIHFNSAQSNLVGGTPLARNIISANFGSGVVMSNAAAQNVVEYNWLGANAIDSAALGNTGHGVELSASTSINNSIQNNLIYYNRGSALRLADDTSTPASGNHFDLNSYRNNLGMTIDIGTAGPTLNDGLDSNPANLRDFPIITSANLVGNQLEIAGYSQAGKRIDFYLSAPALNDHGQALELIASGLVEGTSDLDAGTVNYSTPYAATTVSANRFRFSIPAPDFVRFGTLITAVSIGSSSEFGNVITTGLTAADVANNLAPKITLATSATLATGQSLQLDGSFLDDDSTDWTATVDYGDGTGVQALVLDKSARTFSLNHTYNASSPTPFTATVKIKDNGGKEGIATVSVIVQNEAPEITYNKFTITSKVAEGGRVTLDGLFTDTGLLDHHVVTIDWDDGSVVASNVANPDIAAVPVGATSFRATHLYVDDGVSNTPRDSYRILVTVTDDGNLADTSPDGLFVIEVLNVQPSNIVATLPPLINENDVATLIGSFVDPGVLDKHTVKVHWGDGTSSEMALPVGDRTFNLQHRYLDNPKAPVAQYNVTIEITDDDEPLLPTTLTKSLTVLNSRPVLVASDITLSSNVINEGQSITLAASFTDSGAQDVHQIVIDWGDGSEPKVIDLAAGVTSITGIAHTYLDDPSGIGPNTYAIAVKVRDADMLENDFVTATKNITVNNLPPAFVVPVTGPQFTITRGGIPVTGSLIEGDRVTLSGSYIDPGLLDVPVINISWGDGTSSLAQVNPSTHRFTATHNYLDDNEAAAGLISLTIDDQDGGTSSASTPLLVTNATPTARLLPKPSTSSTVLQFEALADDLGFNDIPSLQYSWTVTVVGTGPAPILSGTNTANLSVNRNGNPSDPYRITLTVTDDEGDAVTLSTHVIVLDDNPNTFAPPLSAQPTGSDSVTILGLDGADTLDLRNWTIPVILDGGAGTDVLYGGSANDVLVLNKGNDSGFGGGGRDRYVMTFNSTLTVDDPVGSNILDFSPTSFGVTFDLNLAVTSAIDVQDVLPSSPGLHYANINGSFGELVGTNQTDRLTGTSGALVDGAGGADNLFAPVGNSSSLSFRGGADADLLTIDFGSFVTSVDFEGDVGADDFLIFGQATNVDFSGGADDDLLTLGVSAIADIVSFEGDVGADEFLILGDVLSSVDFSGGADADLFTIQFGSEVTSASFEGDVGADEFIIFGDVTSVDFSGGADTDVFTIEFGSEVTNASFEGDVGADEFIIFGDASIVDFSGGADTDVFTIEFGSEVTSASFEGDVGADEFIIFGDVTTVDFSGGADKDLLTIELGAEVTSASFEGDVGADEFIILGTVTDLVDFNGGADADLFYLGTLGVVDQVSFEGDDGRDRMELLGRITGNTLGDLPSIPNVPGLVPARDYSLYFRGGNDADVLILGIDSFLTSASFEGDVGADEFVILGEVQLQVDFSGGADDDLLYLGVSAVVDQVSFEGDVGADDFLIESHSSTVAVFDGGADADLFRLGVDATLESASFEGDVGADEFIIFGDVSSSVDFNGGADADLFVLGAESVVNVASFEGDVGADEFYIDGTVVTNVVFDGGADDDLLNLGVSGVVASIDFEGDVGADDLLIFGDVTQSVDFSGGADNDRLLNRASGFDSLTFYGYIGPTQLSAANDGRDLLVNGGSNISSIRFFGGADDDVLYSFGTIINDISFEGDVGADVFVVDGVTIQNVDFDGGADDDVLSLTGSDFLTVSFEGDDAASSGNDTLVNRATGSAATSALPSTITFNGRGGVDAFRNDGNGWDSILFIGGNESDAFQNNADSQPNIRFEGNAGDDVFENNGRFVSNTTFLGDVGLDTFVNDGDGASSLTFTGGGDADLLLNTGDGVTDVVFDGGSGADSLVNFGLNASSFVFLGGDGNDVWQNSSAGLMHARMVGGRDTDLFVNRASGSGASDVRFEAGADDDAADRWINLADNVSAVYVETAVGADLFENRGLNVSNVQLLSGSGDDIALNLGAFLMDFTMTAGDGNDAFENRGDSSKGLRMLGGIGKDTLVQRGRSVTRLNPLLVNTFAVDMDGGDGVDVLANYGNGTDSLRLVGGNDNDRLLNDASLVASIVFTGDAGNDALQNNGSDVDVIQMVGGADQDSLFNNGSRIRLIDFQGGTGADTLINTGSDIGNVLAAPAVPTGILFTAGDQADLLRTQGTNIVRLTFDAGNGDDSLLYNATGNEVNYLAGSGDDVFSYRGTTQRVNFDGSAGKDRVVYAGIAPNLGTTSVTLAGGPDDDRYEFSAAPQGFISLVESYSGVTDASNDTLDFSAFTSGNVAVDLASVAIQNQPGGLTLQLSAGMGLEDVIGSSGADTLVGNNRDNYIGGASYFYAPPSWTPVAQDRATQWVYLDFDSQTSVGDGEHYYTSDERTAIKRRIEAVYYGYEVDGITPRTFNSPDRWFNVRFTSNLSDITTAGVTDYVTILFNGTTPSGRPGGDSSEIDVGNQNYAGTAIVQVNGLLGGIEVSVPAIENFAEELPEDAEQAVGQDKPPATSDNFIALSSKIAAHELAHMLGLRHYDAFGPIGFGIHSPPGVAEFKPLYQGSSAAFETFDHVIGSPASVGTTRANDIGQLFFGEREAIKMAVSMSNPSQVVHTEATLTSRTMPIGANTVAAKQLQLATVEVPNTLLKGFNSAKSFYVQAASVIGAIGLQGTTSENDYYAFQGQEGDLITIELSSEALRRYFSQGVDGTIDSILRLRDASGQIVQFFGADAINDDEFESTDSILMDVRLPASGWYSIEVDTFHRLNSDPEYPLLLDAIAALLALPSRTPEQQELLDKYLDSRDDTDTGNYQLLMYSFAKANQTDLIDNLAGRGGIDVIDGGPGEDYSLQLASMPTATVLTEGGTLTRNLSFTNAGAESWTVTINYGDSSPVTTLTGITPLTGIPFSHLFGDNGSYTVTITVTNDDGLSDSDSFLVTVNNVAPTPTITSISSAGAVGVPLAVTGSASDPAGIRDTITLTWDVFIGSSTTAAFTGTGASFAFTPTVAGAYTIRLTATDEDGGSSSTTASITVNGGNTAPTLGLNSPADTAFYDTTTFQLSATDPDAVDQSGTFTYNINWGDGTTSTVTGPATTTVTHVYTKVSATGSFVITATATDPRGLTSSQVVRSIIVLGWTVMPDPLHAGDCILVVVGSNGADSIRIKEKHEDYFKIRIRDREENVRYRGTVHGDVDRILVFGQGGDDDITLDDDIDVDALIWGGSGNDRIKGGQGNDVIFGDEGDDVLYGREGRDILIGGLGADRIYGDSQDDILIAGYTLYDSSYNQSNALSPQQRRAAIEAIMSEWASARSYTDRRANILGTNSGTNWINRKNGNNFLRSNLATNTDNTVFDDLSEDSLWGDAGTDWFFANINAEAGSVLDRVRDRSGSEAQQDIDRWW